MSRLTDHELQMFRNLIELVWEKSDAESRTMLREQLERYFDFPEGVTSQEYVRHIEKLRLLHVRKGIFSGKPLWQLSGVGFHINLSEQWMEKMFRFKRPVF